MACSQPVLSGRKSAGGAADNAALHSFAHVQRATEAVVHLGQAEEILSGDVEGLARKITESAADVIGCERANVWLFENQGAALRCIDSFEATPKRHSAGLMLHEHEYANEFRAPKASPYFDANDALTDPRTAGYVETYLKPLGITSMLDTVIRASGRNLGLLCFEHVNTRHDWGADEILFAAQLADKISLALVSRARNETEAKLRASEARLRALVEQAPEAILLYDADNSRLIDANRQAEVLFGCSRDELLKAGHQAFDAPIQPGKPETAETFAEHTRRALAGELLARP